MPLLSRDTANVQGAAGKASIGNQDGGLVTTEALNTAAGATASYVVASGQIDSDSVVLVTIQNGSNTQGDPSLQLVNSQSVQGQVTITIVNRHASQAFNGSLIIGLIIFN
jgi:hypothetical protein